MTTIDEIAPDLFRLSIYVPEFDMQFNHFLVRDEEPLKLFDMLLVGALIEARSCERFARLAPRLPERLASFYGGLLASESRHFEHYLDFARSETGVSQADLDARLAELKAIEAQLITEPDSQFRFHSGPPAAR